MALSASGLKQVGSIDIPGGGQVFVQNGVAYVGHMNGPLGTSLIDVSDPSKPRLMSQVELPHKGLVHSHKVQVHGDIMLTNYESQWFLGAPPMDWKGGLAIYDISRPESPEKIGFWACGGSGIHRFCFDGRYAYISPEMPGYIGNIVQILDLKDPTAPQELGRWWAPGQWREGGERGRWVFNNTRVHHPYPMGDRLYVSLWHGGYAILDMSDKSDLKLVAMAECQENSPHPTHSVLPFPFPVAGRQIAIVADEDVQKKRPAPGAEMFIVDISDETAPKTISRFQVAGRETEHTPEHTGCHQPVEIVRGTEIPFAWLREGVRLVDVADPLNPVETAHYVPEPAPGQPRPQTNDVFEDDRGLIYLIDRMQGLTIVERSST
ncbi:MAG: hypothetical protein MRY64_17255 [Hyphomonadaceae bacterium]|nr:hypothetical protein [Hyphomonadaceae bacterium]